MKDDLKVGDRVIVMATRYDVLGRKQSGLIGNIYDIVNSDTLKYKVRFSDHTNSYCSEDIQLYPMCVEDTREYLDVISSLSI